MCPVYMSMGMSYEEYWKGDIYIAPAYKALMEIEKQKENQKLWLQGLYFNNALENALASAFYDGKGKKPEGYMKEPIPLSARERDEAKKRKIQKTLDWIAKGQE